MQKLYLIYTRDVSLFYAQSFWTKLLDREVREVWGKSISTQICHFNGRALEMYRVIQDIDDLRTYIAHLPLTHRLFSEEFKDYIRTKATELRGLFEDVETIGLQDMRGLFEKYQELWSAVYPGYMFSIFLPGAFADAFRAEKGLKAELYIKTQYDNRVFLEGLFVQADHFARRVAERFLDSHQIPSKLAAFLTFDELCDMVFLDKQPDMGELNKRSSGYVLIGSELVIGGSFEEVLKERGFSFDFPKTIGVDSFVGNVAYQSGSVTGRVRLVFTPEDVRSFVEGEILVTAMTAPDFLPAIKKSKAVITDEGGITCHAAIISRELKIPCIIGTKIATKVLHDGDEVEVDADKGIVRILKRA